MYITIVKEFQILNFLDYSFRVTKRYLGEKRIRSADGTPDGFGRTSPTWPTLPSTSGSWANRTSCFRTELSKLRKRFSKKLPTESITNTSSICSNRQTFFRRFRKSLSRLRKCLGLKKVESKKTQKEKRETSFNFFSKFICDNVGSLQTLSPTTFISKKRKESLRLS